jgi:hypothetical protein
MWLEGEAVTSRGHGTDRLLGDNYRTAAHAVADPP